MRHGKTNKANTKSRINRSKISEHTKRFRAQYEALPEGGRRYIGDSIPVYVRTLSSVGGIRPNRKGYGSNHPEFSRKVAPITAVPHRVAIGLQAMMTASITALTTLLPKSRRELKRNV